MAPLQSEFKNKVTKFFKERYIGEIIELNPCSLNRHYIKFKPFSRVWFQKLHDTIEVDSVNFDNKTISGFISNSSKLNIN